MADDNETTIAEIDAVEIPDGYKPHGDQIPPYATDLRRFDLCFAIGRAIAQRDDPILVREPHNDPVGLLTTLAEQVPRPDTPDPPTSNEDQWLRLRGPSASTPATSWWWGSA